MASLTIRNLDSTLKSQLRMQAARHGRSMEAEARIILAQSLSTKTGEQNLALAIHQRFKALDADSLPIPHRQEVRTPPDLGE